MGGLCVAASLALTFSGELARIIAPKQFSVEIKLYRGDPLGSREDGTLRVLMDAKLRTFSGRPAVCQTGGQLAVPTGVRWQGGEPQVTLSYEAVGTMVEVLPIGFGNGKVYVEVNAQVRTPNLARGVKTDAGFVPGFDEQQVRRSVVHLPGKTVTVRLSAASATDQTWVTVVVTERKP